MLEDAKTPVWCNNNWNWLIMLIAENNWTKRKYKKDRWDSGKPRRQQIHFCDIQIKVAISCRQYIYIYIPYRSATIQNLSDLDFDLSRSLKVTQILKAYISQRWLLRPYVTIKHQWEINMGSPMAPLDLTSSDLEKSIKVTQILKAYISQKSLVRPYVTIKH